MIVFLTDFGPNGSHYVASMKGVILKINPNVSIIDLSHNVSPFSIIEASFLIKSCYPYFPDEATFIIVVDPGVGSSREIIGIKTKTNQIFIGPDNGIFPLIFNTEDIAECVLIQNNQYFNKTISNTFHGRDIMAPVSAHISNGVSLKKLGPPSNFDDLIVQEIYYDINSEKNLIGCTIQYIDSFGNATTNIKIEGDLIIGTDIFLQENSNIMLKFNEQTHLGKFTSHFGNVPLGSLLFLKGSSNFVEISKNQGNAAKDIGFKVGDIITFILK